MGGGGDEREVSTSGSDSVRLLLTYAREQYTDIGRRHESVVTRSTSFLGLLAVTITLVATSPFHGAPWRVSSIAGLACVLVAVGFLVRVVYMRTYDLTPNAGPLIDGYVNRPEAETQRQVLANTKQAIEKNENTIREVQSAYKVAAILAGVGIVAIGIGVVLTLLLALIAEV